MRELTGSQPQSPKPLLKIESLSKRFGGLQVLEAFDLEVGASELLCIIGPNGCGKTTLFNVITGTFPPDSGSLTFDGVSISGLRPHQVARMGVTRKFQVPGVYPELTVYQNIAVPLAAAKQVYRPSKLIRGITDTTRAFELLALCGLEGKHNETVSTLSHGERQLLEMAMVLAPDPRLILLDEPTGGMSLVETAATAQLVRRLRNEFGKTVIVIEHDMRFVEMLDCPVSVMLRGRIACTGSYREIREYPEVVTAYLGRAAHA